VLRRAARAEVVEQPRDSGANAGRHSDAQHRRSPTQSSPAVTPLVTITREYASGGSEIARLVVERLGGGWTLIDNEFIDQVAHLAGLSPDEVARREERAPGLLERLAQTLAVASPEMFITTGEHPMPVETEEDLVT